MKLVKSFKRCFIKNQLFYKILADINRKVKKNHTDLVFTIIYILSTTVIVLKTRVSSPRVRSLLMYCLKNRADIHEHSFDVDQRVFGGLYVVLARERRRINRKIAGISSRSHCATPVAFFIFGLCLF